MIECVEGGNSITKRSHDEFLLELQPRLRQQVRRENVREQCKQSQRKVTNFTRSMQSHLDAGGDKQLQRRADIEFLRNRAEVKLLYSIYPRAHKPVIHHMSWSCQTRNLERWHAGNLVQTHLRC